MSAHLMLDTNAVTAIIKDRAKTLSAILNERPSCISVITEAELRFGLARRAVNIALRRIVENYLASVDILPWTSASAQRYGLLRAELDLDEQDIADAVAWARKTPATKKTVSKKPAK